MSDDLPPDWAIERALTLGFTGTRLVDIKRHSAGHTAHIAFARYIAAHEEPPVDPLLIEAREICARQVERKGGHQSAARYRAGEFDDERDYEMGLALAALRRGVEIGREP